MGWNPSINFKLRDDQVVFGNLIFDKNGAALVGEALLSIKNGVPINMEALKKILDDWCFTSEELESLKVEFDEIKQDISDFKSITRSFGCKWTTSVKSIGVAVDYIAGSSTWIQSYKDNKEIAAGLYQNILKTGFIFSPEKKAEYDKRYLEVIQSSTDTELVESYLKKQYQADLASGDPNAVTKYCDSLVEVGILTPAAAKKKFDMMNLFKNAVGDVVRSEDKKSVDTNMTQKKSTPDKDVEVNISLLESIYSEINRAGGKKSISALKIFYDVLIAVYKESGIWSNYPIDKKIEDDRSLWSYAVSLFDILRSDKNRGLVDCSGYTIKQSLIDKIKSTISSANSDDSDGYVSVDDVVIRVIKDAYPKLKTKEQRKMYVGVVNDLLRQTGTDAVSVNEDSDIDELFRVFSEHESDVLNGAVMLKKRYMELASL